MYPGTCLRKVRERLGLTYRDVEQSSYELAKKHGRPEFIIHISRLADFENGDVTPGLHKLYSLCAIYHLDIFEVCLWYDVRLDERFNDSVERCSPLTHLAAAPGNLRIPLRFDPAFDPQRTSYLTRLVEQWSQFEAAFVQARTPYRYGFVGTRDTWMEPLLRRGSLVLLDPRCDRVRSGGWQNEYERPIYFVELKEGYRCSWCSLDRDRLVLQPHPLSTCAPQTYLYPSEAEIIGQVVGVAMRLSAS